MPKHTVDRRTFLGLAAAGTAGTALTPSEALAGLSDPQPRSLDAAMPGVFAHEALIFSPELPFEMGWEDRWAPRCGWSGTKLIRQSIATCLWAGHHGSLSYDERRDETFVAAFERRAEGMANTLYAAGVELDELDDEACGQLDEAYRQSPELLEQARATLLSKAQEDELPPAVKRRFDRAFNNLAWRIEKQGMKSIAADLVGKLDKVTKREGTDWRGQARAAADHGFVLQPAAPAAEVADNQYSRPGRGWRDQPKTAHNYRVRAKRQASSALVLLGIGVGSLTIGVFSGNLGLMAVGATVGVITLLAALFVGLASGRNAAKARKLKGPGWQPFDEL